MIVAIVVIIIVIVIIVLVIVIVIVFVIIIVVVVIRTYCFYCSQVRVDKAALRLNAHWLVVCSVAEPSARADIDIEEWGSQAH